MKKLSLLFSFLVTQSNAYTSYEQAMALQKSEHFTEAIKCYKNIPRHDPQYLSALFNLGLCYLSAGKAEKAIAIYDTILSINPHLIPVLYNKAYTLKTMGNLEAAIGLYKKIIQIDSSYDPAQLALGFAYLINGDFERGWQQHER